MSKVCTHTQHQADYDAGRGAALDDIESFGICQAAAKWREENPIDQQPSSLGAYYYAKGGLETIVENYF